MPFQDAILAGNTLVRDSIKSENYVAGSTGWQISRDGNAEFNNLSSRGGLVTGFAPNARWELSSSHGNQILGFPADNVNTPQPGVLRIDSTQAQINPPRYLYETVLSSPWSSLVPNALGTPNENPRLRLTAHEGTGITWAELQADTVTLINSNLSTAFRINNPAGTPVSVSHTINVDDPVAGGLETWHNFPLANGWVNIGAFITRYRRDVAGNTHIQGRVSSGTTGTIGTLPAAYRPTQALDFAMKSNNDASSISWLIIGTNGAVTVAGNTPAAQVWLALDVTYSTL